MRRPFARVGLLLLPFGVLLACANGGSDSSSGACTGAGCVDASSGGDSETAEGGGDDATGGSSSGTSSGSGSSSGAGSSSGSGSSGGKSGSSSGKGTGSSSGKGTGSSSGHDGGGSKCNATSCPMGCCTASDTCEPYASQSSKSCGAGGAACAACSASEECDTTTGKCVCDATTCPAGCCAANGTCVLYASQTGAKCGAAGAACAACANDLCDTTSGTCACDATTCPNGCCAGGTTGTCEPFAKQGMGSCGLGGAACGACTGGSCCSESNGGACAPQHQDGQGDTYYDCSPLGTYDSKTALEACKAYVDANYSGKTCTAGWTCGADSSLTAACFQVGGGPLGCWVYTGDEIGWAVQGASCTTKVGNNWN